MGRVILVRHGETAATRAARYSGQRETPLTPCGEMQHERLCHRLSGEALSRVVSSDLRRCRVLAGLIAAERGRSAELDPALREASFGAWEGLTYEEGMARDRQAIAAFNHDPAHVAPPQGESLAQVGMRARACLDKLLREQTGRDGALLLVSHGGTLRALLCGLLAIPLDRYWMLRIDPGSVSVLDIYPPGPIVAVLNDTCHLQGLPS
jgi:alpha-ribazole phosphatase